MRSEAMMAFAIGVALAVGAGISAASAVNGHNPSYSTGTAVILGLGSMGFFMAFAALLVVLWLKGDST